MALNVTGGALEFDAVINGSQFQAQINAIERSLQGLTSAAQQEATAIENVVKNATSAIAAYATFTTATGFISDITKVRGEFQQLEVAMNTMLGSKEKADKLMAEVVQLAATTPFTLQEVGSGAKQLIAYGTAAEKVTDTLRRLGDIASGVGAPINDIIYLYGTLQTQGRAYTRDIMQFAQRGIPIYEELAKVLGVSKDQIQGLAESGKIGFPEVEKAFKNLTSAGGKFYNLMDAQSKTLTGQLSNLEDAWASMLNEIGKSNEGLLSGAIEAAGDLVKNYQTVLNILEVLVATYGSYRAAIIATSAVQAIQTSLTQGYTIAETLRYRAMLLSESAMALLNKTMLANPYVAVATGVAALVSAMVIFSRKSVEVKTSQELLADAQKNVGDRIAETQAKFLPYVEQLKNANLSEGQRVDILGKLKEIDPAIVKGLDAKNFSYKQLTSNVDAYVDALRRQLAIESNSGAITESIKNEQAIQKSIDEKQKEFNDLQKKVAESRSAAFNPYGGGGNVGAALALQQLGNEIDALKGKLTQQKNVTHDLANNVSELQNSAGQTSNALLSQKQALEAQLSTLDKTSKAYADVSGQIARMNTLIAARNFGAQVGAQLVTTPKTNKQLIDEAKSLADLDVLRKKLSDDYQKSNDDNNRKALASDLKYVDERKKRLDIYSDEKKAQKDLNAGETKTNELLQQRKGILEEIQNAKRDADQSGLLKEQSAVDQINQRYDNLIQKVKDYNDKVSEANKKRGVNAPLIGQEAINTLNLARNIAVSAEQQKQDVERYKQSTEDKKKIFDDFESYQLQVGKDKAIEVFRGQTQGFQSYIEFLRGELGKLQIDNSVGGNLKKDFLQKALVSAVAEDAKRQVERQAKVYADLFSLTDSYEEKRLAVDEKYGKLHGALMAQMTTLSKEEYDRQNQLLIDARNKDIETLDASITRQSTLFQKLGQETINFSREALVKRVNDLKKILDTGLFNGKKINLTPEVINAIQSAINQAQGIIDSSDDATIHLNKMVTAGSKLGPAFQNLASNLQGINSELAAAVSFVGNIITGLTSAASSLKDFKKAQQEKNTAGQISAGFGIVGAAVGVVSSVVGIFTKAAEERKRIAAEQAAFTNQLFLGEVSINELYRQRTLEIARQNKLRLEGLNAEIKALEDSKPKIQDDFNNVLTELQKQTAKVLTKKLNAGFSQETNDKFIQQLLDAGLTIDQINEKFKNMQDTFANISLKGLNFDHLEQLFIKGQLDDKAKALFEQLQKLKQEGLDVDKALADAKRQAQEVFTGTTADSLLDGIVDAFKQGKRTAADFADNFQDLMKGAVLNALKFQYLQKPLGDFFDQFDAAAESGGGLTKGEIDDLQNKYNQIIADAGKKFDELQKIAGLNLSSTGTTNTNNLSGAIKGMTEDQAQLLAGQFGGMRLTLMDQLKYAQQSLAVHQMIEANTAAAVIELAKQTKILKDVTTPGGSVKINT